MSSRFAWSPHHSQVTSHAFVLTVRFFPMGNSLDSLRG
jgi:hypothetical protein